MDISTTWALWGILACLVVLCQKPLRLLLGTIVIVGASVGVFILGVVALLGLLIIEGPKGVRAALNEVKP